MALLSRMRSEFLEMPGLGLTLRQAARLFGLMPSSARSRCERSSRPASCDTDALAPSASARNDSVDGARTGTSVLVSSSLLPDVFTLYVEPVTLPISGTHLVPGRFPRRAAQTRSVRLHQIVIQFSELG
jgi:hypothetical protein